MKKILMQHPASESATFKQPGLGSLLLLLIMCSTPLSQIRADLVGYWAFDEGQGTNILDSSSYGNNGVLAGATPATWVQGRLRSALCFDGTSATGVYIPSRPSLQLSNAASFAAWVRCDNATASPIFAKEGNSPYFLSYWFGIAGGHFGVQLDQNGAQPWDFANITEGNILAGQWIHLAATWDGTAVRYYTNGVLMADSNTVTSPIFQGSARLGIGINSEYGNYKFTGAIDEVRIYNHALSQEEVSALAALGQTPAWTLPPGLVASYNANGSTADSSGGGDDGVFAGEYVPGIQGQAFWIHGQTNNFGTSARNLPVGSTPRTLTCWINIHGDPGPSSDSMAGEWIAYGGPNGSQQFGIGYYNQAVSGLQQNQLTVPQRNLSGPVLSTNTWYYVALTYDGSTLKLYTNGSFYSSTTASVQTPVSATLWCSYKNPDFYADNIRVYDAALTPSQIMADYNILVVSDRTLPSGPVQWRVSDGGNDHWYEILAHGTNLNWAAAQSAAVTRGGYLACITSAAENNFIFGLINWPKYWESRSWGRMGPWLGGTYSYSQPTGWSWISGEAWGYSNWFPGEPDYYIGIDDRVAFSTVGNVNPPFQSTWGDVGHADTSPAYVVEYDSLGGVVRLTGIGFDGQGRLVLGWESNPANNVTYTVESCTSLGSGSWSAVEPASQWPITSNLWTNQAAETSGQRFFRVNALFQR